MTLWLAAGFCNTYLFAKAKGKKNIKIPIDWRLYHKSVCVYEVGTVGKISDCQPEGPGFNPRPGQGSRVELWATFFRHTVRGQGR